VARGSCLCGKVTFEIDEAQAKLINNCHCSRCRKGSGAAYGSFLQISLDHFRWLSGEDLICVYSPVPDNPRPFCTVCGSRLPIVMEQWNHVAVPAGLLDDDPGIKPSVHIYVGSKAPWHDICDDLPQFEEQPPGRKD